MTIGLMEGIGLGVVAYGAFGLITTVALLAGLVARIDPAAAAAPIRVKLLWAPGLVALWPVALLRVAGRSAPEDRG
jgi:hypothetical protein